MDKLKDFVNEQIKNGTDPSAMKYNLVKNGWKESDVDSAIGDALGKKSRSRIVFGIVGVIIVGLLVLLLISYAKPSSKQSQTNPPLINIDNNVELKTNNPVDSCKDKESIEKDDCYKVLLKSGFDCSSLTDNIERTYCIRAYEDLNVLGVERISEN